MKISPAIVKLANDKLNHLFSDDTWKDQVKKREKKNMTSNLFADDVLQRLSYISHTATIIHGQFIEELYIQAVAATCEYLSVWKEEKFKISRDAFDISGRQNDTTILKSELVYGDVLKINNKPKTRQIDFCTFNKETGTLCSYEIKRGGGTHDSEKKEKIVANLIAVQLLLKNYGKSKNLDVKKAKSFIVSHYNSILLPTKWKRLEVNGKNINDHFGRPVKEQLLLGEEYFQEQFNLKIEQFKKLIN